jgi:glyceraldehyde-3-phosphate dehydrogenase/erythrose-4-phosphate dehydrogenase
MTKVAINGMGRIGRAAFKIVIDWPEVELVAVNDLMGLDNLVYLLNYDTVHAVYKHRVVSSDDRMRMICRASCTTNCIVPVVEIMGRRIGIKKAVMTTIPAYTSSQDIVDGSNKKFRRGRVGANLVLTSTGAALATTHTRPRYKGKFDGVAVRCSLPSGCVVDLVFVTERPTTVEEINQIFKEETDGRYKNILEYATNPNVSADIIGVLNAYIFDPSRTHVVDGDLVKIMSWCDNEWGYTNQMVRQVGGVSKRLASSRKNKAVERKCVERQERKDVRKECPMGFCPPQEISRSGLWGKIMDIVIIGKLLWDFFKPYLPI